MANVDVKCAYGCGNKVLLPEYSEARYNGWVTIGWNMNTNIPYILCPNCDKERLNKKATPRFIRQDEPEPEPEMAPEPVVIEKKKRGRPRKIK